MVMGRLLLLFLSLDLSAILYPTWKGQGRGMPGFFLPCLYRIAVITRAQVSLISELEKTKMA